MAASCYGVPQFRMRVFLWGCHPDEVKYFHIIKYSCSIIFMFLFHVQQFNPTEIQHVWNSAEIPCSAV
ncbi:DNA (cytosine-5)-methyltransferase 1 [Platanthera zijinensis]|uniref:DNA (Cytosine-5)-methyltransferase 1 n=1 Tax=Platanthera zijinensis TaxID=2320716 RepID=A0AAP0GG93_9ASPA